MDNVLALQLLAPSGADPCPYSFASCQSEVSCASERSAIDTQELQPVS
jgi:hypothetical protein